MRYPAAFSLAALLTLAPAVCAQSDTTPGPETPGHAVAPTDIVFTVQGADGVAFDAKLTIPAAPRGPVPVVFFLHGAGPRTYDSTFRYADDQGAVQVGRFLDFHAAQLASRGIAFFRTCKRGCAPADEPPYMHIDREVFSRATLSVIVGDYEQALVALRARPEIDPERIVLLGASEGTRAGPLLARRAPDGIVGIAMMGYAADNARLTVQWQNTVGPWRNIEHLIPTARDGALTRADHDELAKAQPGLARALPFDALDADKNGEVTDADLRAINAPHYEALLRAIHDKDDDYIWQNLLNLSSAYLADWWDDPPNAENLLALDVPMAIFHGGLDGACRVDGVRETEEAFRAAGRAGLAVHIYPDGNHDLDWTWRNAREGGPQPYRDAFDFIEGLVRAPPR